jgi:hypothetical protein
MCRMGRPLLGSDRPGAYKYGQRQSEKHHDLADGVF